MIRELNGDTFRHFATDCWCVEELNESSVFLFPRVMRSETNLLPDNSTPRKTLGLLKQNK